jgi:hypothetical protein
MFRLFRLLRKLFSRGQVQFGTWRVQDVLECSGCSGFSANFLERQSFHYTWQFQDVQDVQDV